MSPEELIAAFEVNATTVKPVAVLVPNVGTVYVRKRTIDEFEELAGTGEENVEGEPPKKRFAPSLASMLCDENGHRYPDEVQKKLAELLSKQPHEVFTTLVEASDGKKKEEKGKPEKK